VYLPAYSKYFYSKLNEQEKEVYTTISNGWLSYKEQISVRVQSYLDFNKIIQYISCDIPELFYVDFSRITTSYVPGYATVFASFIYAKSEYEAIAKQLKNTVSSIADEACRFSDKEKYIHDYLAKNVSYSYDTSNTAAHSAKGALLDGCAVCEGYAKAFKLLCDAVKIPCIVLLGTALNNAHEKENHVWNIIKQGTNKFHVDVTWNSSTYKDGYSLYYNVSDDFISKDHFWDRSLLPPCTEKGELEKSIVVIKGINSLDTALKEKINSRENKFILYLTKKFESTNEVLKLLGERLEANNLYNVRSFFVAYNQRVSCAVVSFDYRT